MRRRRAQPGESSIGLFEDSFYLRKVGRFVGAPGGLEDERPKLSDYSYNDVLRLLIAQAQQVPAQAKFDGVAERRSSYQLHAGTVAESHLQEPAAHLAITAHAQHR